MIDDNFCDVPAEIAYVSTLRELIHGIHSTALTQSTAPSVAGPRAERWPTLSEGAT